MSDNRNSPVKACSQNTITGIHSAYTILPWPIAGASATPPHPTGGKHATLMCRAGQQCPTELQFYRSAESLFARWRYRVAGTDRTVGVGQIEPITGKIWWTEWGCVEEQAWDGWFHHFDSPTDCQCSGESAVGVFKEVDGAPMLWGGWMSGDRSIVWVPDPADLAGDHWNEVQFLLVLRNYRQLLQTPIRASTEEIHAAVAQWRAQRGLESP